MLASLDPALLAVALAAAAVTAPAVAATAEPLPASSVRYDDLDLTSARDIGRLNNRVKAAADKVCGRVDPRNLMEQRQIMACRDVALNGARPRIALAVAAARADRRLALNSAAAPIGPAAR